MVSLTKLEKLMFPSFLCVFQLVFIILYALLVRYDETGKPHVDLEVSSTNSVVRTLESYQSALKVYPFFQDVHVMIFVGFGFLMTFLRRYGFGSIAFNMLLASFAIQWSTLTSGVFQFIDQADEDDCCTIRINLESIVGSDFAGAAVLITMGAVLGRASPFQLIIIAFFELMFYSANEALNAHVLMAADVGGSMLIHTFGAYFGLAVSFMLYNKRAEDHDKNSSVYHSDLFSMIGTLFLWLFWPSFNGALATANAQQRAIINTYFAMAASVLCTFIFSTFFDGKRKLTMAHVQNATLAGGVAVGAMADMVIQPWGALVIGSLAAFISVVGYKFLSPMFSRWFYLQDTCGVHNLHGMPGVFAGIGSAIAAAVADLDGGNGKVEYGDSLFLVFPARAPSNETHLTPSQRALEIETGDGRHAGTQAGYQLAFLASTLAIAILGGLITGVIVRWLPVFQPPSGDTLFDDKGYWDLPDDADDYLPPEKKEEEEETEEGGTHLRLRGPGATRGSYSPSAAESKAETQI